ncbi:MAG: response regulator [Longicatena sp.]
MVKILVVEDEKIERETLVHILKENIKDSLVFEARNGKDAIALFEKEQANIVCADINMPGINGLDMIRDMKGKNTKAQFLIVSSYNYFEYAQQAIRLGIADFILKPYNIAEFLQAIETVIQKLTSFDVNQVDAFEMKIQEMIPQRIHECLYAIISDESEIELYRKVHALNPKITSGMCVLYRGIQEDFLLEQLHAIFSSSTYQIIQEKIHGFLTCFVLGDKSFSKEDIVNVCEQLENNLTNEAGLGIGTMVNNIDNFHDSFLKARDHVGKQLPFQQQIYDNVNTLGVHINHMHNYVEDTLTIFENLEEASLKNIIKKICDDVLMLDKEDILHHIDEYYEELLVSIKRQYMDIDLHDFMLLPLRISTNVYQELDINLTLNLKKLYHNVSDLRFKNTNHLVKEALHFIEHNYKKPITLSDLADHLKVSPFYISKLLSTTMHKTFTEMLAKKRVDVSKELLRGDVQIKEIASRVGFQGQSYFNKIFKKYTGMTPKVYRNKMKR